MAPTDDPAGADTGTTTTDDDAAAAAAAAATAAAATSAADDLTPPADDADPEEWKAYARKWERRAKSAPEQKEAKKLRRQLEEATAKLQERENATKSEHEKALEQARTEARQEALTEAEKDRRKDRLEVAVTRAAATGVKITDGDSEKTVKFADPEDALVHLERAIANGDVDSDDIFNSEGKVQTDALTTALADLIVRKPHLIANGNTSAARPTGSADAGRGSGGGKGVEDMSTDEHLASIKRHK